MASESEINMPYSHEIIILIRNIGSYTKKSLVIISNYCYKST